MADRMELRYLERVALWRDRNLPAAVERLASVIAGQPHDGRDDWWHAAPGALVQIALESDGPKAQHQAPDVGDPRA